MSLHRICFNSDSADTRADSHTIGSILYDQVNDRMGVINADNELLVHDQSVVDALTTLGVTLDSSYAEDSAHTSGDDGQFMLSLRVDDITAVPASVLADTEGDYQALITGPDGGLLTCSKTLDGTGNPITSTSGALDVNITSGMVDVDDGLANTAIKQVAETVGVAAAQIIDGGDELASRKYVFLYNNSKRVMYIGDSGVTTTDGFPLFPCSALEARIGDAVDIYAIGSAAALNMRTLQLS